MRYSSLRKLLLLLILCSFSFSLAPSQGFDDPAKLEAGRARLISYILKNDLTRYHFTKKKLDDTFSKAAFGIYLKQLDPQKRFLLKEDVTRLNEYSDKIDDEMNTNNIRLPEIEGGILTARTAQVHEMVNDILSKDFTFSTDETIETDAEKLDFCSTADELKERWRKTLKYQVLSRYLSMIEDDEKSQHPPTDQTKAEKKQPEDLLESAKNKISKNYESIFSRLLQEKPRERYDRYFESVTKAFDPHTDYMPPVDKEDFDIGMKGSLEGIGATLKEEDGYIKVV